MKKWARVLGVWLIATSSLTAHDVAAGAASGRRCSDQRTTVDVEDFSAGGVVGEIAIGPDGNVWFTLYESDKIGRLTPRGKTKTFDEGITPNPDRAVPGAVGPLGITKGPDGNMWFTEYGADRIGRITPDGTITEFSGITPPTVPDSRDAAPSSIVTGSDGNLWFTEQYADRIGRITPDGAITEFGAGINPSPGQLLPGLHQYQLSQPTDITLGPDGNVWFVERLAGRVGRVTPAGAITEFMIPFESPTYVDDYGHQQYRIIGTNSITAGPDDNVWFTQTTGGPPMEGHHLRYGAGAVGRITPTGAITEFSEGFSPGPPEIVEGLPPEPSPVGLRGLVSGNDGNLWALEAGGLVRITPVGEVSHFPADLGVGVLGDQSMIAGPKGTFWFPNIDRGITRVTIGCAKKN